MIPTVYALEAALREVWNSPDCASARTNAHEICPGLWLGGCEAPPPPGLTHVVTLWDPDRDDVPTWPIDDDKQLVVRIRDDVDAPIGAPLPRCTAFLADALTDGVDAEPKRVALVHCQMGRSRSAAVAVAFLVEHL